MNGAQPVKISIVGAGYVGLVAAVCLAKQGNRITLIDVDEARLRSISSGRSPIYEEGLEAMLREISLETTSDFRRTLDSKVILLCVGTPSNPDGSMSLQALVRASEQLAEVMRARDDYCVVAIKSTVVPGTTEDVVIPILESSGREAGSNFGVCMTPEFLREGKAIHDYLNPARIVIGQYDEKSGDTLMQLHSGFGAPVIRTDLRTAEMIKIASNCFLATKISFINEVGNICKTMGIDVRQVAEAMGLDDRIGKHFLNAGIGFGGSCIPKDLGGLISRAKQAGCGARLLEGVRQVNDEQPRRLVDLAERHVPLNGSTIGLLGLAFKPGTDDIRESRAAEIVRILGERGAAVKAYDPLAMTSFERAFPGVSCVGPEEVLRCDAVLIVTEWEEFERLDYRDRIVIDGRGIAKAREARIYEGVCW